MFNYHGLSKFHDATLTCVDFQSGNVNLKFNLVGGTTSILSLIDVKRFVCNNLREGNIVLEIAIICDSNKYESYLENLYEMPVVKNEKERFFLKSVINSLESGEIFLLKISPSYGFEILGLCSAIQSKESKGTGTPQSLGINKNGI